MRPPILKWLGGKRNHLPYLQTLFEGHREVLVEPFVGSGVVFLNTDFKEYVLGDANRDLIELYKYAIVTPEALISEMRQPFADGFSKARYLELRGEFNALDYDIRRASLFVYLNRFGFNGLCRYNQMGGFNVPFGNYVEPERGPRLPENAIMAFAEKASRCKVTLEHAGFEETLGDIPDPSNTVVYADPPYVPVSATANFVGYTGEGFNMGHQRRLAAMLDEHSHHGGLSVLSNSATEQTMLIFANPASRTHYLNIKRPIAASAQSRAPVRECIITLGREYPVLTKEQSAAAGAAYVQRYVDEHQIDEAVFWFSQGLAPLHMAKGRIVPQTPGKIVGWCKDVDSARHGGKFFYRVLGGQVNIEYI